MTSTPNGERAQENPFLGWRHRVRVPDPGPPPKRPTPADIARLSDEWVDHNRREHVATNWPLRGAAVALAVTTPLWPLLAQLRILPWALAVVLVVVWVLLAVPVAVALWQGHSVTRSRLDEARRRVAQDREARERELHDRQHEHAERYRQWEQRKRAFDAQPRWYPVRVADDIHRLDVVGGTDAGWAALLASLTSSTLQVGGDVTVIDLSGRAVGADLVRLARGCGVEARAHILPGDLPRVDITARLDPEERADVLAATFGGDADDTAMLRRLVEAVGGDMPRVMAGLRVLAAEDGAVDTPESDEGELDSDQRRALRKRFGSAAPVAERAWRVEQRLASLEQLGTRAAATSAQVTVVALDRASGREAAGRFGALAVAALRRTLRRGADVRGRFWQHTVVICGADRLPGGAQRELGEAARRANAGVVLLHRGEPDTPPSAGTAFAAMRIIDAGLAELALTRLRPDGAAPPPLRPHPLTEVIGAALQGTVTDSYPPADGPEEGREPGGGQADAVPDDGTAGPGEEGRPRRRAAVPPLELVRHLRAATTWGRTTRQAEELDAGDPLGEGTTNPLELTRRGLTELPETALVLRDDRGPVLVDVNPGIMGLPTATLAETEPPTRLPDPGEAPEPPRANLGPPPERLDWRRSEA